MTDRPTIVPIPHCFLSAMLPFLLPSLKDGMTAADDVDLDRELADVAAGKTRVWGVFRDDRVVAAFLTSVVDRKDGRRALDVYGLGGCGMLGWGRALSEAVTAFARLNECAVCVFRGRKALLRAYRGSGIKVVGQHADGNFLYEKVIAP